MSKKITLDKAKEKQLNGIIKTVDIMAITIGPRGGNVCLTNGDIVNDGKRIAEDIILKDPIENKGATKVRNMVRKISTDVGGGRTACAILYKELCQTGLNLLERGFNGNLIKKGMDLAVKDIIVELDKMAKPVKGKLKEIATISTESEELGQVIADVMNKVGKDSVVTVEESQIFGVTSEIAEGLKFDKGWISPYMITDRDRLEAEYKDIPVLILNKKISFFSEIQPTLDALVKKKIKNLLIIAEDIDEGTLRALAFAKFNGLFNVLAIKTPGIGDMKKFCIEDLCALTGTEVNEDITKEAKLGKAKKVLSTKDSTIIMGGDVKHWITTLNTRKEITDNVWEKDQYNERIAKLQNGIAVIKVGASSEDEVKYLKLKIEDGVNETKRALEEGIVMGGNVALIHAQKHLQVTNVSKSVDEVNGYNIVTKSIVAPLKQIVKNSSGFPDVVISKIYELESLTTGYNALDNTIVEDMYKLGIIDAVKVVKAVLQYAVSEAGIFITIEGDISEEVIEK